MSRDNPEVSVLMSCYNGSRWLCEAIESILSQTFGDFEFILVDDGSSDETLDICWRYQKYDERIIVVSKHKTGLADSLNVGISKVKGTWIARMDQDDIAEPVRLEEQITYGRTHQKVLLLGTGCVEIDETGCVLKKHLYPSGHFQLVKNLERMKRFFPHSSAFYRTDVVRKIGGYNPRIHRAEDRRLWLELSLHGVLACLPKYLLRIRKHNNQMSRDDMGRRQYFDSVAATVCYQLKKAGRDDPSSTASNENWNEFLEWVERKVIQSRACERREEWERFRSMYFAAENRVTGLLNFSRCLLGSGHAYSVIREKLFGTSLPKRLAQEWISEDR